MRLLTLLLILLLSLAWQGYHHEPSVRAEPSKPSSMSSASGSKSVLMFERKVKGVPVKMVVADMNNPRIRLGVVTSRTLGQAESVWKLLAYARPTAAITGTYFSLNTKFPVGDIVLEGAPIHLGGVGTALCVTYDNQIRFVRATRDRLSLWGEYRLVLGAGPRLLKDGKVHLNPSAEGFRDRGVYGRSIRTAVGITRHNRFLMVVVEKPVSLRTLAHIMQELGATDAIALDGGGSSSLFYRQQLVVAPKRHLTNLLVLYESDEEYTRRLSALKPREILRAQR